LVEVCAYDTSFLLQGYFCGTAKLGNVSLDGSKVHADASKSKAVSYKRLQELETRLRQEVEELLGSKIVS